MTDSGDETDKESLKEKFMESDVAGLAIISVAVLGGGVLLYGLVSSASQIDGDAASEITVEGSPVMGDEDADVTIAYFGDYSCPLCSRYDQNTFPDLQEQLIETGEVQYVKKNLPVVTDQSEQLAVASAEVWSQVGDSNPEQFWDWHEAMFTTQRAERPVWTASQITDVTETVDGIDAEEVEAAIDEERHIEKVNQELSEAEAVGAGSTPSFVIYSEEDSELLSGTQPINRFEDAVEQVQP